MGFTVYTRLSTRILTVEYRGNELCNQSPVEIFCVETEFTMSLENNFLGPVPSTPSNKYELGVNK